MLHNALTRFTELQRGAKVAFGLDAGAGGIERLGETLQVVKDFWAYPEDALARGARIAQGNVTVAAGGAGNYSGASFAIQNEGWIATLLDIVVGTNATGYVVVKRGLPLPAGGTKVFRDCRITNQNPIGALGTINNVAAVPGGTVAARYRAVATTPLLIPLDWVHVATAPIATETACVVYHETANSIIEVTFRWIERQLLPGELMR
jgi:hypothetical protein